MLILLYAPWQVKGAKGTYIANVAGTQGTYNTTVISFNKGAKWSPVTAPLLDSDMLPVECYYVSWRREFPVFCSVAIQHIYLY